MKCNINKLVTHSSLHLQHDQAKLQYELNANIPNIIREHKTFRALEIKQIYTSQHVQLCKCRKNEVDDAAQYHLVVFLGHM